MKLFILLTIITANTVISVNAQQFVIKTQRPLLSEIASLEEKEGGSAYNYGSFVRFTVSKDYFPGADKYSLDNPLTWFRTSPCKIEVQYYYSLPDSIIRLVQYTANNSDTALLSKIYNNNIQQLTAEFGKISSDKREDHEDWWKRTSIWENKETYVNQFMIVGSGTYRVRVLISWK